MMKKTLKNLKKELKKDSIKSEFGDHSKLKKIPSLRTYFGHHSIEDHKKELKEEKSDDNDQEAARIEKLHKSLVPHYDTDNEADNGRIRHYTDYSRNLNDYLHRKFHGGETNIHSEARAVGLQNALMKHRTPHELTVYSGLHYSPEEFFHSHGQRKGEHNEFVHPSFLSTSLSKHQASKFTENDPDSVHGKSNRLGESLHMLKIHVPKNHPGSYVAHISEVPREKEFILPHHTHLRVHRTPEHDPDTGTWLWHAHVLPHKEEHE